MTVQPDLVARLRERADLERYGVLADEVNADLFEEAAGEIERLRVAGSEGQTA